MAPHTDKTNKNKFKTTCTYLKSCFVYFGTCVFVKVTWKSRATYLSIRNTAPAVIYVFSRAQNQLQVLRYLFLIFPSTNFGGRCS